MKMKNPGYLQILFSFKGGVKVGWRKGDYQQMIMMNEEE